MPQKGKKILITSEKYEQTLIHFKRDPPEEGFCPECDEKVIVIRLDDAARSLKVGTRDLLELIDSGAVHGIEEADGILSLCGRSLAVRIAGSKRA